MVRKVVLSIVALMVVFSVIGLAYVSAQVQLTGGRDGVILGGETGVLIWTNDTNEIRVLNQYEGKNLITPGDFFMQGFANNKIQWNTGAMWEDNLGETWFEQSDYFKFNTTRSGMLFEIMDEDGVFINGSQVCTLATGCGGGGGGEGKAGDGIYLTNNSNTMFFNETLLNITIDNRQSGVMKLVGINNTNTGYASDAFPIYNLTTTDTSNAQAYIYSAQGYFFKTPANSFRWVMNIYDCEGNVLETSGEEFLGNAFGLSEGRQPWYFEAYDTGLSDCYYLEVDEQTGSTVNRVTMAKLTKVMA